jgi:hypothetical protein
MNKYSVMSVPQISRNLQIERAYYEMVYDLATLQERFDPCFDKKIESISIQAKMLILNPYLCHVLECRDDKWDSLDEWVLKDIKEILAAVAIHRMSLRGILKGRK